MGADSLVHVFAVEADELLLAFVEDGQLDLGEQGGHAGLVPGINALTEGVKADGAVERAGVNIEITQFFGGSGSDAAFAGSGGAVDGLPLSLVLQEAGERGG